MFEIYKNSFLQDEHPEWKEKFSQVLKAFRDRQLAASAPVTEQEQAEPFSRDFEPLSPISGQKRSTRDVEFSDLYFEDKRPHHIVPPYQSAVRHFVLHNKGFSYDGQVMTCPNGMQIPNSSLDAFLLEKIPTEKSSR